MDAMKDFGLDWAVADDSAESLPNVAAEQDPAVRASMPPDIDHDERRMQVRAYNFWAGLLEGRDFPSIEDFSPEDDADFGPYSVLLDFTEGMENPGIAFLGEKLAEQCGVESDITGLEQVPARSLLTRLTDHYLQIFANQAPIGFEAEFVNQRGETVLYRGIMLPFSSDDDTIDFIYGVINWKVTDAAAAQDFVPPPRMPFTLDRTHEDEDDDEEGVGFGGTPQPLFVRDAPEISPEISQEISGQAATAEEAAEYVPDLPADPLPEAEPLESEHPLAEEEPAMPDPPAEISDPASTEIPFSLPGEGEMELADWLVQARACADAAKSNEDRSRQALYQAIGRAYDFSLAAADAPEDYAELIRDAGLTVQNRAPMTPLVKLVFGADYDKTRLTEYATALSHAHRLELERGSLAPFLSRAEGGLKGVIAAERSMRREESGKPAEASKGPRPALASKLREMPPRSFDALSPQGDEFALILARRLPNGEVVMLGEVPRDVPLLERAARKLVG